MLQNYSSFSPSVRKTLSLLSGKKVLSDKLSRIYHNLGFRRARSKSPLVDGIDFLAKSHGVDNCSKQITLFDDGKFFRPCFCHDRLCPICSWRRSQSLQAQMFKVVEEMRSDYDFILLTLTVPNVPFDQCRGKIEQMMNAYHSFSQEKSLIGKGIKGWFRSLEVTYNASSNTYHPHFHCLLAVTKDYWDRFFVDTNQFWKAWKRCMGCDESILVRPDVRRIYSYAGKSISSAVCEVTKYAVKPSDILNTQFSEQLVREYSFILKGVQMYGFKGVFSKYRKKLLSADLDTVDTLDLFDSFLHKDSFVHKFTWNFLFDSYDHNSSTPFSEVFPEIYRDSVEYFNGCYKFFDL